MVAAATAQVWNENNPNPHTRGFAGNLGAVLLGSPPQSRAVSHPRHELQAVIGGSGRAGGNGSPPLPPDRLVSSTKGESLETGLLSDAVATKAGEQGIS